MSASSTPDPSLFADQGLADLIGEVNRRPSQLDIAALRAGGASRAAARQQGPVMTSVTDLLVPADASGPPVAVRVYRPTPQASSVVVYAHGGGWTIGSLDTHDRICRRLASAADLTVVSVDYRLAPEHPAPAAVQDVVAVLEWVATAPGVLAGAGGGPVAVAGDSAGGTLAALTCSWLKSAGSSVLPDLQVLVYANTDLTGPGASMQDKAAGWGLDVESIEFFNHQWVPERARWSEPDVSPLRSPDLTGLPPALVITAEHDPLRDQGESYAERLRAAGVDVLARREPGLVHNFLMYDEASPACAEAGDRLAADVRQLLQR